MKVLKVEIRTGETVSFDAGRVALTLLEKSGQRARLEIRSAPDVLIELPTRASPAQQAQGGISPPALPLSTWPATSPVPASS